MKETEHIVKSGGGVCLVLIIEDECNYLILRSYIFGCLDWDLDSFISFPVDIGKPFNPVDDFHEDRGSGLVCI